MKLIFIFCIGALTLVTSTAKDEGDEWFWQKNSLTVGTSNGKVSGYLTKSCRSGREYAGFKGIPYAEPPLGELRFRSPVPRKNWEGTWDATFERPSCIQSGLDEASAIYDNGYSEDCLYLNIYTPNVEYLKSRLSFLHPLKPVMVFIHPGAFTTGSTAENLVAPDFLIDTDVVVVTFNYRLGALGFLSLQNEDVPGNGGLKDQNLALRWVKENIKNFGGDPSKITIFGESAGSASVHYHILSKASAGLFRNAIMQSGTAFSSWAYSTPELSLRKAENLAKKVGCLKKNSTELLMCLQKVPAQLIVENQQKALTVDELLSLKIIAFHPTTEPNVPGAFLTSHPFELMDSGNFSKVPVIIGMTMNEGLLVYPTLTKHDPHGLLLTLIGMDLSRFAPYYFHLRPLTKPAVYAHREISKFYFNSVLLTKAQLNNALELVTDVMFTVPIQLTADMISRQSVPVYNYLFSYEGNYNLIKAGMGIMNVRGVCHGDDLGYLFYTEKLHENCGKNVSPDGTMIDRMTTMWSNFAKTGNPQPDGNVKWEPFTSTDRNYLDIGIDLTLSDSLKLSKVMFWKNLIENLLDYTKPGSTKEAIDDLELPSLYN